VKREEGHLAAKLDGNVELEDYAGRGEPCPYRKDRRR
jgi:hypothetical protein